MHTLGEVAVRCEGPPADPKTSVSCAPFGLAPPAPDPPRTRAPGRPTISLVPKAGLVELEHKRVKFQHLYAEEVIGLDDLRACLAELDGERKVAERELAALRDKSERLEKLEQEAETILEGYAEWLRRPSMPSPQKSATNSTRYSGLRS